MTSAHAEKERQKRDFNTWRLLVRNPDFLQDLEALRQLRTDWQTAKTREALDSYHSQETKICDKWGLLHFPPCAKAVSWTDPESLEEAYQDYRQHTFPLTFSPVFVEGVKEDRFLFLRLDTSLPREDVLAALDGEVREFYRNREGHTTRRGRPDKLEDQLVIYDSVEEMRKKSDQARFDIVAGNMHKSSSTVRDAYWSVYHKIRFAQNPKGTATRDPGPVEECLDPRCRSAINENDLRKARAKLCHAHKKAFSF
jgi:hypothetical protein